MRKLGNESGQTLVFVALGISILLGFAAFATDIGIMLREQNLAQHAADSAAIAAATRLDFGASVAYQAALKDASQNGFTDGSNGVTVTVSDPPTSGEVDNSVFANKGFVKVTISKDTPGYFMKLFNRNSMTVAASAVATNRAQSDYCIYVLDPDDSNAMNLQGSFSVNAPKCGIVVDSMSGSALNFNGSKGTLIAASVDVVGGANGQTGDSTPAPTLNVAPVSDPLASEPTTPIPSSCTGTGNYTLTGTANPGCYGNGTGTITLKNVTLNAGLYIFNGPVALSGTVDSGTGGVTLYLANGGLTATTNSTLNLTAPLSATDDNPYGGILIYDQGANTIEIEAGNSTTGATGTITGIIYAPKAQFYVHDSGGDAAGGNTLLSFDIDLVVNTFNDQTGVLNLTSYHETVGASTSPLTKVTLVE
jgi:Flp pilus assembly protein TadG